MSGSATESKVLDGGVKTVRTYRMGDKVRSKIDDGFVSVGLTGIVNHYNPYSVSMPKTADVTWDNDTKSIINVEDIEVLK